VVAIGTVGWLGTMAVIYLAERIPYYATIAIVGLVMSLFFGKAGVEGLKEVVGFGANLMADRGRLRTFQKGIPTRREEITLQFTALRTGFYRRKYVDWLERVTINSQEVLRESDNLWPDGRRPQMEGDRASVKLAQLDARWLDLD